MLTFNGTDLCWLVPQPLRVYIYSGGERGSFRGRSLKKLNEPHGSTSKDLEKSLNSKCLTRTYKKTSL